jgi:hypothetical protein
MYLIININKLDMNDLYCLAVIQCLNKPKILGKYVVKSSYSDQTIVDILEGEDLNIEIGASHAFEYEGLKYLMNFVSSDILLCVVSGKEYKRQVLVKLVLEMKTQYDNMLKYGSKQSYSFLKTLGETYKDPQKFDTIAKLESKINNVKSVMQQNIEMALVNCQTLENLELRAQELSQSAGIFKDTSGRLRKKMWWKNFRMKFYIGLFVLCVLGLIIGILCAMYPPNKK